MPETTTITAEAQPTTTSIANTETQPDFNTIGIEFEYPIGDTSYTEGPDLYGHNSSGLVGANWELGIDGVPDCEQAGSDHIGAEVRSPVFDLHTTQPEQWFVGSIEHAENNDAPYAANGSGYTNFGLHMHLSQLTDEQRDFIADLSTNEVWMRVFVTSSISGTSADPWRHGGVAGSEINPHSPTGNRRTIQSANVANNLRHYERHYEWRLPEPMMPSQFSMVMHFLRLVSLNEFEEAEEYARDAVMRADERLTPVMQYEMAKQQNDDFPFNGALDQDRYTDDFAAEFMANIMGDL